jgi:hypothetical protein
MKVKLGQAPSERQRLFIELSCRRQLYGGAKRGGKSVALCMKGIMLSVLYPGNRGGLFRQDLTDLRDSLLVTFMQICPRELIVSHHLTYKQIVLKTGENTPPSTILYGGLGDAHDIESAKGKEFGWIAIDEPSEVDPDAVRMLEAQLCWKLPDGSFPPYMILLASNPEPGWIEEEFRFLIEESNDRVPLVLDNLRGKAFVRALPRDNPYLPPNWETMMRVDAPEAWTKKYLDGSWEVSEGQVFKEFDRSVHVIPMPPPAFLTRLKLVASIDHATTGVTCMAVDGIDPDGNIFALGEYYEKNKLISEHAQGMIGLMSHWADRCGKAHLIEAKKCTDPQVHPVCHAFEEGILIDPSTQAKTLQNRDALASVQDEYLRQGIPTMPAWNALESGVNLMQEYLHVKATHIHPLTTQLGSPSFFILGKENPNGVREMISWRKTPAGTGRPGESFKVKYVGPDHWLDNQRYIIMSRPEPPRIVTGDLRATGDPMVDSINRTAMRDMAKFDKKFRPPGEHTDQWFPGGGGNSNTWFEGG